ncbi:hypothetical protein D8674_007904 [Pyrus ussuriensis x Pyrus communis]|uniref:Uncharacterized protein n=1 Tax=Pyrus ussuriensis x Pyrus communis TaxID=2448454 RepID=A0A5N5HRB8_9ROSA|nr:hypothetical protein D8674_007904 [Pyrus ussuriensis x Pyrus communis]
MESMNRGGSFSFSCSESDLNFSSLSHFTDDNDDEDDESYIEIALDHHHDHPKPSSQDDDEEEDEDLGRGELDRADYLRISFSSSLLPELSAINLPPNHVSEAADHPVNQIPSSPTVSYSCPLSSSSMEDSCRNPIGLDEPSRLRRSTSAKGRLPRVNRLVNTLLFGLRSSSESPTPADDANLSRNRKASNIKTSINGGLMKFLFKFRAMNLGALVASLVKPRQVAYDDDDPHQSQNINRRCKNKKSKESSSSTLQWLVQKKQGKSSRTKNSSEAVGGGISRKEGRTRSCQSSIKSSPIHQGFTSDDHSNKVSLYTRENSIQSAIAHCKTSFEQTSIS